MSNFTPTVKFETTFENDVIIMKLKRLKRKSMMKLMPFISAKEADDKGTVTGQIKDMELMDMAADILPEHVVSFAGLKDQAGAAISLDAMLEESYFISLQGDIISKLFAISKLQEEEIKNSEGQPSTLPTAQKSLGEKPLPDSFAKTGLERSVDAVIKSKEA